MGRLLDLDDFLDPKSLTPQELYKLQSDTWVQGAEHEHERIIKLMEEAGLYDDELTPEEIVTAVKQVRKEMAEERAKKDTDEQVD